MDNISFNPAKYQYKISNIMDKLLNDSILSFNPYNKDNLFITNFIKDVFDKLDGSISNLNYFGTLFSRPLKSPFL